MLPGKRANFLIFDFLGNISIHMLCMTMKLGQGDRVSVCGFVGQACDCHVTHVTLYTLSNEAPSRKTLGIKLSYFF